MEFESTIKDLNSWLSNQYNVTEPYLTFDENSIGGNHFSPGINVINITSVDEFKNPINKREACWIFLHEYRHYLQYLGKVHNS